jgi:molybdopterin synthase sulfur carrier subunit
MKVNFFATLRQIVGTKTVDITVATPVSVRELLNQIIQAYPEIEQKLVDENGEVYPYVHIFINGRDYQYLIEGADSTLTENDTVNIFPAVGGG